MITKLKPDIVKILEREGVALKQRGRNFWSLCPLHSEKTPSFKIDSERQTFYCFGCNQGGNVISLIMKLKGLSFKDALVYLDIATGKPYKPDPRQIKKRELVKGFKQWCDNHYGELCEFYRLWDDVKAGIKTIGDAEKYSKFYHAEPVIVYRMDILFNRDEETKFELYREINYAS